VSRSSGLGYVGLPLALLYTEQEFPVTGFDIDQRKVSTLVQGGSYIFRIPATEIQEARARGFEGDLRVLAHNGDGCHHHLRSNSSG
jgi:UDP-N-acetyl-D-mannosaminuronate dehydrogenase